MWGRKEGRRREEIREPKGLQDEGVLGEVGTRSVPERW